MLSASGNTTQYPQTSSAVAKVPATRLGEERSGLVVLFLPNSSTPVLGEEGLDLNNVPNVVVPMLLGRKVWILIRFQLELVSLILGRRSGNTFSY